MDSTAKQIVDTFGAVANKAELLMLCSKMLKTFEFDVDELYINWESFTFAKTKESNDPDFKIELNETNLLDLQQYIIKNMEKKAKQNNHNTNSTKKTRRITSSPMILGDMFNLTPNGKRKLAGNFNLNSDGMKSTKYQKTLLSSSPIKMTTDPDVSMDMSIDNTVNTSVMNFDFNASVINGHDNNEKVITTLNSGIKESEGLEYENIEKNPILLANNFDPEKYKFRIMRQKLLEVADVLDEQIDNFTNYLSENNKEFNEIGNPNLKSQEDIYTVGRITADSPATKFEESINSDSICLEPSRFGGFGQRIKLNLSNVNNYSLFPGQIVGFKGRNANGKFFTVNEIFEAPLLGAPSSTAEELKDYNNGLNGKNLKMVITAGPYTTNDSFDFGNLQKLVTDINTTIKPHTVIMFGPFLDYSHPKIVDGTIEESLPNDIVAKIKTLDDVFRLLITPILKEIHPLVQVILIPSTKDVVSRHPSYPQSSFDRKYLGLPKNFKCFPNPSSFQVNECLIGVSNNDIYKDLKDVTVGTEVMKINRFDRITNHILSQRRYYPLFPAGIYHQKVKLISPPPDTIDDKIINNNINPLTKPFEIQQVSGADLDLPYFGLTEFTDATPDILIIPSQLKYFARVSKNVVAINPGNFMKPKYKGSYAVLNIQAPVIEGDDVNVTKIEDDQEELYIHDVWKRCRVDIVNT